MDQRVDIVTVRTENVEVAVAQYGGLGWDCLLHVEGEIAFFQVGHGRVLGFFEAEQFDRDVGEPGHSFTLALNVDREDGVVETAQEMAARGATIVKEPQTADFGGFHALVKDATGVVWEIAHNPGWSVGPDGTVEIRPVE